MVINLKVALGGAAGQYLRNVEAEEEYLRQMRTKRSDYLFAKGEEKFTEIEELSKAAKKRVKDATAFGFSQEAAMVLEVTDQLAPQLKRLKTEEEKGGAINTDAIKTVSKLVTDTFSEQPELMAEVFKYMGNGGYPENINEMQDKFSTILLSVTGDMDEAAKILRNMDALDVPDVGPISFQTRALTDMGATERNSVIKNIQATLGGYINDTTINEQGTWVGANKNAAQRIQNEILNYYTKQRSNPSYTGDIGDVLSEAAQSIQRQVSADGANLSTITIFNPPVDKDEEDITLPIRRPEPLPIRLEP